MSNECKNPPDLSCSECSNCSGTYELRLLCRNCFSWVFSQECLDDHDLDCAGQ
jgi:hypothetical protein